MSCRVGRRHVSSLALLWLRHKLAAAALIQPLAWKLAYALGGAPPPKKTASYFVDIDKLMLKFTWKGKYKQTGKSIQ